MSDMNFSVTPSEVEAYLQKIDQENQNFRDCAKKLKAAGDALVDGIEGDFRTKFEERMEQRVAWLEQMAQKTDEYVAAAKKAMADYQAADEQVAATVKSR